MAGQDLETVDEIRDLGVLVDSNLRFDSHIKKTVNKGFRMMGFVLRNAKEFKKSSSKIKLFQALVLPGLEFNSVIWTPHYEVYIKRLESVQKRFLYHLAFGDLEAERLPGYSQRLEHYKLTSLINRRKRLDLIFLHKIVNGSLDCPELLNMLQFNTPCRLPRKSAYNFFAVVGSKTNLGHFALLPRLCRTYNSLSKLHDLDIGLGLNNYKRRLCDILNT
ncbi:uncharacterized protein LOC113234212 [Hyposmocoma kahamanoa]|uniref:uncharacterized protein LOC113234212 n=1 Tax=Hyposmocoma kahamanoa TaxID=1477025 RepID=UPI000E6D760D|nr:uncharacterized protein LOC113234212 [Hyposmocoma kahamanoa]